MQPCLAGCQAPPPLRTSWAARPERLGRTVTALEERGAPEAAVEQACPVVSHHGMWGGGGVSGNHRKTCRTGPRVARWSLTGCCRGYGVSHLGWIWSSRVFHKT